VSASCQEESPILGAVKRCLRLLLLFLLVVGPSLLGDGDEDEDWEDDGRRDHERARRALEEADLRPLAEILAAVEKDGDARVIEVELERERGRFLYELKVLTGKGRLVELEIDASSGAILERERAEEDEDGWTSARTEREWEERERAGKGEKRSARPRGREFRLREEEAEKSRRGGEGTAPAGPGSARGKDSGTTDRPGEDAAGPASPEHAEEAVSDSAPTGEEGNDE